MNPYVFSRRLDFVAFGLPLVLAALLASVTPVDVVTKTPGGWTLVLYNAMIGMMIDHGHIYGTVIPVFLDRFRRARLKWRMWAIPLAVLTVGIGLTLYSAALFRAVLAYVACLHICRQQYGWLTLLERKEGANRFFRLDRAFFISSILVPLYFWQSRLGAVVPQWFYPDDMPLALPQSLWPVLAAIHIVIALAFVGSLIQRRISGRPMSQGKLFFLLMNWIWFFGGLVLSPRPAFFWFTLILCHGISYHIHVNTYWGKSFGGSWPKWIRNRSLGYFAAYFFLIFCAGRANAAFFNQFLNYRPGVFLVNFCLICHYTYDAVVWRRSYRPPETDGLVVQAVSEPEIEDQIHRAAVVAYD